MRWTLEGGAGSENRRLSPDAERVRGATLAPMGCYGCDMAPNGDCAHARCSAEREDKQDSWREGKSRQKSKIGANMY